jgi:ribonuclease D
MMEELKRLPGMSEGQVQRHGGSLLRLVQKGLQGNPVQPPRHRRPDEQYLLRLENLRQWRKETARQLGVKSDVILPRDVLTSIAEKNPREKEQLASILGELPWRLEKYGEDILTVLNNHHS